MVRLSVEVRTTIGALESTIERIVKQVTLEAVAILTEDTPRDTGWARTNWIPRIGGPIDGAAGDRESVATSASAQQSGVASVATYRLPMGKVYITNHVPYIQRLNEGSSRQAPAGFVERSLVAAVTSIERAPRAR